VLADEEATLKTEEVRLEGIEPVEEKRVSTGAAVEVA